MTVIRTERVPHEAGLVSFRLTFADGTERCISAAPQESDPNGKRFLDRALLSLEARTTASAAHRGRSFA